MVKYPCANCKCNHGKCGSGMCEKWKNWFKYEWKRTTNKIRYYVEAKKEKEYFRYEIKDVKKDE